MKAKFMTIALILGVSIMKAQNIQDRKKKILFVVTSHDQKGSTGEPTGYYLSEVAHPWNELVNGGYEIDFVSPRGGNPPVTGFDLTDKINRKFWKDKVYRHKRENTMTPSQVNPDNYIAVHYAGGLGSMWDFADNNELASIAARVYENGGIVSAVCHGPAGLLNVKLSNGEYLVKGRKINGYSNEEEAVLKMEKVVPFLLETTLIERGALFEKSGVAQVHVVTDSRVVTGQNPQSAKAVGAAVVEQLTHLESEAVLTCYEIKKGHRTKVRKVLTKYVKRANEKKANIMAEAYYEQQNPTVFWTIERWSNNRSFEKMRQGAKYKSIKKMSAKKLVEPIRTIFIKDLEPMSKNDWQKIPAKDDDPLTIMLFVDSKKGTEDDFVKIYHAAMPQFRSEPGVINYQLSQFENDKTQFVTYEKFRNEEAFQYHLNFTPVQPIIDYLNTNIKQQPFQAGLRKLINFTTGEHQ